MYDGAEALAYLESGAYDAAVMDVMMPVMDGFTALRHLRTSGNKTPVLMLSALSKAEDKVEGLDDGANYYLTKPFDTKELLAAIRAITRSDLAADHRLVCGNIVLNRATFELSSASGSFRLANKEFQLMETLLANSQQIIPTQRLLEKIWGFDSDADVNVVRVYISYLRKKLTALEANVSIRSIKNVGYLLEEEA